jgi:hypothetical protein
MVHLVVHLFAHPGRLDALRAYESKALGILRRHRGDVVAAFAPEPDASSDLPDEIQVLRFPDRDAYAAFLRDPARAALAGEREAAVRASRVFVSATPIAY